MQCVCLLELQKDGNKLVATRTKTAPRGAEIGKNVGTMQQVVFTLF